jgi:hypothetical protein
VRIEKRFVCTEVGSKNKINRYNEGRETERGIFRDGSSVTRLGEILPNKKTG